MARGFLNQLQRMRASCCGGAPLLRAAPDAAVPASAGTVEATSYYDTTPLRATLERLVDFDRINAGRDALQRRRRQRPHRQLRLLRHHDPHIRPEHVMASGALPPGLPRGRDRGRALLGRRPGLQHAAAMGGRERAAPGYAGLPGRSVERARRLPRDLPEVDSAAEGDPAIPAARAPTPTSSRRMQKRSRGARGPARAAAADGAQEDEDVEASAARSPTTRSTTSST